LSIDESSNFDLIAEAIPNQLQPQNITIQPTEVCKVISQCDTMKIKGSTNHCLFSPTATFTLYKNPQCLRKTKWIIDTTIIKIISQPNDTTINVKFMQPYHGYIRAAFEDCILKDSLFIDVNTPKQSLNLGKDTIFCPSKTIILNAGSGFKWYKWQDNSTNSNYTVMQAGKYFVTAIDSCNNIFTDTILVKPMDVSFNLTYPNSICLYDTAYINVNPKLKNYLWTPSNDAFKINNTIKFYPTSTTLYTIKADRFNGCTLSDTLLIKVLKCPIYFYVPNAFTPNNDNLNDKFKPLISGKMEHYQFTIYNRYGQQVFTSTNPSLGWDGRFGNNSYVEMGTYVWMCKYQFFNQAPVLKKGTFILLR
jgi:gliding motility-associated-like protein